MSDHNTMTELFKALNKEEVLEHVRFRGLKVSGTKAALIERLLDDTNGDLDELLRKGARDFAGWNIILEEFGLSPRRSFADIAEDIRELFGDEDEDEDDDDEEEEDEEDDDDERDLCVFLVWMMSPTELAAFCTYHQVSLRGSKEARVERLLAAIDGNLDTLLRYSGWKLKNWNAFAAELDLERSRSYEDFIEQLWDFYDAIGDEEEQEEDDDIFRDANRIKGYSYDSVYANQTPRDYQIAAHDKLIAGLNRAQALSTLGVLLHLGTGGGKTFVANEVVTSWLKAHGGYVLWVTKDWWLLRQAASARAGRVLGAADTLHRIGGTSAKLPVAELVLSGNLADGAVVFTTLHTLQRRKRSKQLPKRRPSLVVWDECHWAEKSTIGNALRAWLKGGNTYSPILGLTATPRPSTRLKVAYSKSFSELVDLKFLARPDITTVGTGVTWRPQRSAGGHGDFRPTDLGRLAKTAKRNELIIEHYKANANDYKRTLVFACDIDHANRLAKLAAKRGIGAAALHSHNTDGENEAYVADFRAGKFPLLINVAKMTHGVDIPEIDSVFLCRPTTSDILFSQMIGRGARISRGAPCVASFHLVEFTDNVAKFGDALVKADIFYEGAQQGDATRPAASTSAKVHERHAFDPHGQFRTLSEAASMELPELSGLTFRDRQTYGVEVELTTDGDVPEPGSRRWDGPAAIMNTALKEAAPGLVRSAPYGGYQLGNHTQWTTEFDSSAGWEVVSRVLEGEAGILELAKVLAGLSDAAKVCDARVNYRTGLHLHVGWEIPHEPAADTAVRLVRLLQWVHVLEPWLATLVAPSRVVAFDGGGYDVDEPNSYCQPVSTAYPLAKYALRQPSLAQLERYTETNGAAAKYSTINLAPFWKHGAVEVRFHGGSTDVVKIARWLSLWTAILWMAEQGAPPATSYTVRDVIVPSFQGMGAVAELMPAQGKDSLAAWLLSRQQQVARLWRRDPQLRDHGAPAA